MPLISPETRMRSLLAPALRGQPISDEALSEAIAWASSPAWAVPIEPGAPVVHLAPVHRGYGTIGSWGDGL
jgi:hypothetical protein